ncbi:hypothetical protein AB6A40_009643 [Gnathostoma spinigerum]|uniref:G-protein coupled receptors family 1 profile domain-containing protein n=1 Tax=Gnathostoma spinigerum TaxID=75299 RepID=A0ABD6ESI9_9BILA
MVIDHLPLRVSLESRVFVNSRGRRECGRIAIFSQQFETPSREVVGRQICRKTKRLSVQKKTFGVYHCDKCHLTHSTSDKFGRSTLLAGTYLFERCTMLDSTLEALVSRRTGIPTDCFSNISLSGLTLNEDDLIVEGVNAFRFAWIPMPMAFIGFILSSTFMICLARAMIANTVSRRYYMLLLNRSLGDMFCSFSVFCCCSYAVVVRRISFSDELMYTLDTIFLACFWFALVSYGTLSFIKMHAVLRPIKFLLRVKFRCYSYIVIASWIVFAVAVLWALSITPLINITFAGCKLETCIHYVNRIQCIATVGAYLITVGLFAATCILIWRQLHSIARNSGDANGPRPNRGIAIWRLAIRVITFTAFNLPYVVFCAYLIFQQPCYLAWNFVRIVRILSYMRGGMLLRMSIDVVVCFIVEKEMLDQLLLIIGCGKRRKNKNKLTASQISNQSDESILPSKSSFSARATQAQ